MLKTKIKGQYKINWRRYQINWQRDLIIKDTQKRWKDCNEGEIG